MDADQNSDELLFDMLFGTEGKAETKARASGPEDASLAAPERSKTSKATELPEASKPPLHEAPKGDMSLDGRSTTGTMLSSLQERLWVVQQMDPKSTAYLIPCHMMLQGALDTKALKQAIQLVWSRHEALRSIFPLVEGVPTKTQLPNKALTVKEYEFSALGESGEWQAHYYATQLRDFDLGKGPLFQACIYTFSPTKHAVLLDLHHLNADGISMEILRTEIFDAYEAFEEGREPVLPPSSESYDCFVEEEQIRRASPAHAQDMKACIASLQGAPTRIDFHFDKPLPPNFRFQGNHLVSQSRDKALQNRLLERGRKAGLSPFMVYLAAFGSLLHLHTGQEDLLVGIPVSLRTDARFDHTIGFFVNTCVVRLDFSGSPTLAEIIRRTGKAVRAMMSCPDMSLETLVQELHDKRIPDRPPLIQASLSYMMHEKAPASAARKFSIEHLALRRSAMFELTLDVNVQPDSTYFSLEYSSDAWTEKSGRRFVEHYEMLLGALADQPELRVDEVKLLAPAAAQRVCEALRGSTLTPDARCLTQWVQEHVRSTPDKTAVIAAGRESSYNELDRLSRVRRAQLRAFGLKGGDVLALACIASLDWVATTLAALSENIVVLPLDTAIPRERLRFVLEDAGASVLWHDEHFTQSAFWEIASCRFVKATEAPELPPCEDEAKPQGEATAYILYTSGTTGQPKGVRVGQAAFEHHCRSAGLAYELSPKDRMLVFAPSFFDASWEQLFSPLLLGASVVLRDKELWSPEDLCQRIERHAISCADLPPQYLREFLFYLKENPAQVPAKLRLMIAGGEAMPASLAQGWLEGPLGSLPLINAYGPTEAVVTACYNRITAGARTDTANGVMPIGKPMPGRILHILDQKGRELGEGLAGELCLEGPCLAEGYHGDKPRTEQAFQFWCATPAGGAWVSRNTPGAIRLYRSGDRVRLGPDSQIEFLGRTDKQIKIRGFRIEPGEIETQLGRHPAIAQALVTVFDDPVAGKQLAAYCVSSGKAQTTHAELGAWLSQWLPAHMIPATSVFLPSLPTTASGKIDVAALPSPKLELPGQLPPAPPADALARKISAIWAEVLGRAQVGMNDNFFDLGGHSLLLVRVHTRLQNELGVKIPLVDLFANPSVARLSAKLRGETTIHAERRKPANAGDIAVIGMAGRFPDAANVEELWGNVREGRECIRFFTTAELEAAGVPRSQYEVSGYVPAHGHMEGTRLFDAGFFGYTPKEAEIIDPQQRLFLEEAWHALENAGYDPERYTGDIGVFGGVGMSMYLLNNLASRLGDAQKADAYAISMSTDKDFLTMRVSYKLNLRGPSVNTNTACSTSLVAIHLAAESLLQGDCDIALAGGVTLSIPEVGGYVYQAGGIASPDGHCRTFSEDARGTVGGSGVALVVLKRLEQALADGDSIHAVLKGSAINNDGSDKVGFTAPGVNRQRDVIRAALSKANLSAGAIQYIEAHGTATPMGDPIEIQALTEAFNADGPAAQTCYVGSIKSNIGHLDTAAGVAGFIKTVCALKHGVIPPSLHCERPSTKIGFERTPFRVAQTLIPWPAGTRRRAGVSAFGMGGTNAHAILEEAPENLSMAPSQEGLWCLPLSARSTQSLLSFATKLASHLETTSDIDALALWFTLAEGRTRFAIRTVLLATSRMEAISYLRTLSAADLLHLDKEGRPLSGTGLPQVARYREDAHFKKALNFAQRWLSGEHAPGCTGLPARRIPLPGYVFDHEVYWIEPEQTAGQHHSPKQDMPVRKTPEDWFYFPTWERLPARRLDNNQLGACLVLQGESAIERNWLAAFREHVPELHSCAGAEAFAQTLTQLKHGKDNKLVCILSAALGLNPGNADDYARRLDSLLGELRAVASARADWTLQVILLAPKADDHNDTEDPVFAYLEAAATVLPHEYDGVKACVLRIDPLDLRTGTLHATRQAATQAGDHQLLGISMGQVWSRRHQALPAESAELGAETLRKNGVYLITGGLGGVGLSLARHLAETCQARLILLSRNQPDQEQQMLLDGLRTAGATVKLVQLDVADAAGLRGLVDETISQHGALDGVIHAAGVAGGSLIARTQLEEIKRVLRAKVNGTEALAAALAGRKVPFVLLCSSLTAALGAPGQIAYVAANAWMDSFAQQQAGRDATRWISLQWEAWNSVGMAVRTQRTPAAPTRGQGRLLREWTVSPESFWPWGEHRIEGAAVLPGTAYLELMVLALGEQNPLALGSIALNEPLIHQGKRSRSIRVYREENELVLVSDDGKRQHEHARAKVFGALDGSPAALLTEIQARCPLQSPGKSEAESKGIVIDAGPRWNICASFFYGESESFAELQLPLDFASDLPEHPLHPALLDLALSYPIATVKSGTELLPWRYEKLTVHRPLERLIFSHARTKSQNDRALILDLNLYNVSGQLLLQVEGYTLVRSNTIAGSNPAQREEGQPPNPYALSPREGIDVFQRVLAMAEPLISVCTLDWKFAAKPAGLNLDQSKATIPEIEETSRRRPRPELAITYRAPGTPAETLIEKVWGEVLGFDKLGVDDDLFDLGADSLAALQASARVRELTGREFSMERFFAQATIANLAKDMPVPEQKSKAEVAANETWEEGEL